MAVTLQTLVVRLGLDSSNFVDSMNAAAKSVNEFIATASGMSRGLLVVSGVAAGLGASVAGALVLSARAAIENEAALTRLRGNLGVTGEAADRLAKAFQAQAEELSRLTAFSNNELIAVQGLLLAYGRTADQVLRLTPAIVDLATATGRDLTQAALMLSFALNGSSFSARRLGISLQELRRTGGDVEKIVELIRNRFGAAAETASGTLGVRLAQLRNALSNLREAFGEPLLRPVADLVKRLTDFTNAIAEFLKAHPALTAALGRIAAAAAIALAAIGGVAGLAAGINQLVIGLRLAAPAVAVLTKALAGVAAAAAGLGAGFLAIVAAVAAGLVVVARNWDVVVASFKAGAAFIGSVVGDIRKFFVGLSLVVAGVATMNVRMLSEGVGILRDALGSAAEAARGRYAAALEDARKKTEDAAASAVEYVESLEDLQDRLKQAGIELEIMSKRLEVAAVRTAIDALKATGLTEADVAAIQSRLERTRTEIAERAAADRVALTKEEIAGIEALIRQNQAEQARTVPGAAGWDQLIAKEKELLDQRLASRKRLADAEGELAAARLRIEQAAAAVLAKVESERRDAELASEKAFLERLADLGKAKVEAEKAIGDARVQAAKERLDRLLEQERRTEELRAAALRSFVDLERTLSSQLLSLQQQLAEQRFAIEEQDLRERQRRRLFLVSRGLADMEAVLKQNAADEDALQRRRIQSQIDFEERRIALQQRQAARAIQAAQAEAESKKRILALETKVRLEQLALDERLKVENLATSFNIARADTEFKIRQYRLETEAKIRAEREKLKAEEAAADPTRAAEIRRRRAEIERLIAKDATDFEAVEIEKLNLLHRNAQEQITLIRRGAAEQRAAIEAEAAVRSAAIEGEVAEKVSGIVARSVEEQARSLERLGAVRGQLLNQRAALEEQIAAQGGVATAEQQKQLGFFSRRIGDVDRTIGSLQATIDAGVRSMSGGVEALAGALDTRLGPAVDKTIVNLRNLFATVAEGFARLIDPVIERIRSVADPLRLAVGVLPGAGLVPGAVGGPVAQHVQNVFNVSGTQIRLSADEQALFMRLLSHIFSAAGNRDMERFFRSMLGNQPSVTSNP